MKKSNVILRIAIAVLACGFGVSAAWAQELNSEKIQLIERTVSSICSTVKDLRGETVQLDAKAKAELGGAILSKIIPVGAEIGVGGSYASYVGLSQDATATAVEGDRGCRERVFNRMLDFFSAQAARAAGAVPAPATTAPPVKRSMGCVVTNPSGRPMNVRETPNGIIKEIIDNGSYVQPLRLASAENGMSWAYVADVRGRELGWMYVPYLACRPDIQ